MIAELYDDRACVLGEGPLWHPVRGQLFWFDIMRGRLLSRVDDKALEWQFDRNVSAAGWISAERLLVASETDLFTFDLTTEASEHVIGLEQDNAVTRSNDGRADPWGGFWIGTMGKHAEPDAGAVYRFYKGELRCIAPGIKVSNAICFAPDRSAAYYTDTPTHQVMRMSLHPDTGWPDGPAQVHLDLSADGLNPDGAVTDAAGNLWIAQWGASRVACYAPGGQFLRAIAVGSAQSSCPAFGGADLSDLYVTSAAVNVPTAEATPHTGMTFVARGVGRGVTEPQVIL